MPNPDICDKCWEEYYDRTGSPVDEVESCRDLSKWFCPEAAIPDDILGKDDPPPGNCQKMFEHAVATGMTNTEKQSVK
jgi:hypothetical protein